MRAAPERRRAARSLALTGSLARRLEQLRHEAAFHFATHPTEPGGGRRARSIHHPETVKATQYSTVLAHVEVAERHLWRRRWTAAQTAYESAERAAELARTATAADRAGQVHDRAVELADEVSRLKSREDEARERRSKSGRRPKLTADLYSGCLDAHPEWLKLSRRERARRVAVVLKLDRSTVRKFEKANEGSRKPAS
jgi:hypothetical protein